VHTQGFSMTVMGPGRVQLVPAEDLACCSDRVEFVGLRAVLGWPLVWAIELDHPLTDTRQRSGQAASVASGSLHSPAAIAGRRVDVGPLDGFVVAVVVRRELRGCDDAGRLGVQDGGGDPIPVGVDADDVIDKFCKHDVGASS
jgi:hypothetical protein